MMPPNDPEKMPRQNNLKLIIFYRVRSISSFIARFSSGQQKTKMTSFMLKIISVKQRWPWRQEACPTAVFFKGRSHMRAVYYDRFGPADVLQLGERPMPEPGPGQVLIKVAATSVNPIDRRLRAGELQAFFQRTFPIIPGWDVAGKIVKLGSGVSDWKVGDAVAGLAFTWSLHHGGYAEYIPVDATAIARKPEALSYTETAALPLVALTAWQALTENAGVKFGQSVFVQAGAGGLGSASIALAKHLGAKVYTTTRENNFAYVKARGADQPIDYTAENYVHAIKKFEPEGVDTVLELLSDFHHLQNAVRVCKTGGAVVYMNNEPPEMPDIEKRAIRAEWIHHRPDGRMLGPLLELFAGGSVKLPEITVLPLAEAVQAHILSESGRTRGKIVLEVQKLE
jgi:NADPH:quinone reductase-like Zn-dependent oxidoreductase